MSAKNYTVYWTKSAQGDLTAMLRFIASSSMERSRITFDNVRNTASKLQNFPFRGNVIPEFMYYNVEIYRELTVDNLRIIYRVEKARVYVLAIFDARRSVEDILLKRIIRD